MLPTIYKVTSIDMGTLSVMAKPVGGEWVEEEFSGLRSLGVDHVVSLLEQAEQYEVGLDNEPLLCSENDMEFTAFPIPDRGLPDTKAAISLADQLLGRIRSGEHVVVHCRAGIGRTGIIASAVLVRAGHSSKAALEMVSSARGVQVPDTEEQSQWVVSVETVGT